MLIATTF